MKLEFAGKRVNIRKLRLSDAGEIYEGARHREVSRWTANIPYPYPKDAAKSFIRRAHYKIKKKKSYEFGIILKETGRLIGVAGLVGINQKNKSGEIGYWLRRDFWGLGLMTESVQLVINFGFKVVNYTTLSHDASCFCD